MQEMIKNLFYLGAGAAFMTKEKLEELKNELVEKGKLTQEEGKEFVDELAKKSDDLKKTFEKKVNEAVSEQLDKMDVATDDDIADLRKQIQELRAMIKKQQKEEK